MKKTTTIILLLFALISNNFVFSDDISNAENIAVEEKENYIIILKDAKSKVDLYLSNVSHDELYSHRFGDEISRRLRLIDKEYTYETQAAPGAFSGKLIVEKPVIYNSILKLEKHFTRRVGKNYDFNKNELMRILNIGILIRYEDTSEFEDCLEKASNVEEILEVFNKVKVE
ncbi:MAG: hypothetical protein ACOXZ9_04390 [Bacteroidales bacterium]|jgi:hypothetical protein